MQQLVPSENLLNGPWRTVGVFDHGAARLMSSRLVSCGINHRLCLDGRMTRLYVASADLQSAVDLTPLCSLQGSPTTDDESYRRYRRLVIVLPLGAFMGALFQYVTAISQSWCIAAGAFVLSLIVELIATRGADSRRSEGGPTNQMLQH